MALLQTLAICGSATGVHANTVAYPETDEVSPWGLRIISGMDYAFSTDLVLEESGVSSKAEGDFGAGYAAGAAFGYAWTEGAADGWMLEFEYTYRSSGSGDADASVFGNGAKSQVASVAIGPTIWYKPDYLLWDRFKPKVGLGIYWLQEVSLDIERGSVERSFDDSGVLYSLTTGIDWAFRQNWVLGAEARYYKSSSLNAENEDDPSQSLEFDYQGFNLLFSIAYRF